VCTNCVRSLHAVFGFAVHPSPINYSRCSILAAVQPPWRCKMIQPAVPNDGGETSDEYDVSSLMRVYGSSAEPWVLGRGLDNCAAMASRRP